MASPTNKQKLDNMRHSAAHVLAAASQQLKPETRLGVGPATEDGFYHDIDVDNLYSTADLKKLHQKMEEIKQMDLPITQRTVSKKEAKKLFADDPFKLELIDEVEGDEVGLSDMGNGFFTTLCEGGHAASTGAIGFFQLTRLAGVYWRGDSTKPQLQRIYGILFPTKEELKEHRRLLAEAKKRDHRQLGQKLDLFTFSPLVGSGLPLFTPRGTIIRRELEDFLQSIQEPLGYQRVSIPHITKADLYKTSGHWEKFQEDLFHVKGKSKSEFVIKPMNCPHHTQIYAAQARSYRDLPLRFSEVTAVYRDEQAGELQGLNRVRSITQDDAHIFCTNDQIQSEVATALETVNAFYQAFDFKLSVTLSTQDPKQPDKYLGTPDIWKQSEQQLTEALDNAAIKYETAAGEAAFYGPKIDFSARDSLKRTWQLATVQLDFNMPERFKLKYTDDSGQAQTPVMIHRAIMGSLERFIAILLEHYAGNLPLWLSPAQTIVLPISDNQQDYAAKVQQELRSAGIRTDIDERGISIGKKIHDAAAMKIPYMLVIGQKEADANTVSIRSRESGDEGAQPLADIKKQLLELIANKK